MVFYYPARLREKYLDSGKRRLAFRQVANGLASARLACNIVGHQATPDSWF
jgi:hypothetical protein